MKKIIQTSMLLAVLLFAVSVTRAQAQAAPAHYKDFVGDNPTADADVKTVTDFTNALVSGDLAKAKSLMSADYKGYGPAATDSVNFDQEIAAWQQNYKDQTDRKVGFVTVTFQVLSGNLKGNWVAIWGDYTFTESGKTITFPFHSSSLVVNGKVKENVIYYDRLAILQGLGYTIMPPAAK
jgi:ketosteroid isomerase-like protein